MVKIGVASGGSSLDRMLQINRDYYQKFRTTFACNIKRDREVLAEDVFKFETTLHKFFADYQYKAKTKFDGSSEIFVVPLDDAVQAYEAVIEGNVPDCKYVMPEQDPEDELPF